MTVKAIVGEVTLKVTRGDHRPWEEKWRRAQAALAEIRSAYSADARSLGNDEVDHRVETFFVECDHLRDWIEGDVALDATVKEAAQKHFASSEAILLCNALCNTHKHHTRRSGRTARIRETEIGPQGARVTIEVDWATSHASIRDALDLAEACVASWKNFLSDQGLVGD